MSPAADIVKSDEEIKTDVTAELSWDSRVDASGVDVHVENGVVTLTGTAPTMGAKAGAGADAWAVRGVTRVENRIGVELPATPPPPTDDTIRQSARNALQWNPDLDASGIRATVDRGAVTLSGSVPSHWQKGLADDVVAGLRGVISVLNKLAVTPTERFADEVVGRDVVDALERSGVVDADAVDVTVTDGSVSLKGTVPSVAAREAAFRAADRTAGVVNVQNDLVASS